VFSMLSRFQLACQTVAHAVSSCVYACVPCSLRLWDNMCFVVRGLCASLIAAVTCPTRRAGRPHAYVGTVVLQPET